MKNVTIITLCTLVVVLSYYVYFARTCFYAQGFSARDIIYINQHNQRIYEQMALPGDTFACSMIMEEL